MSKDLKKRTRGASNPAHSLHSSAKAANNKDECCCSNRTKERTGEEHKSLINRLSRIEGQIRGIKNMVDKDAYCTDIIMQVSAVTAALNSFNKELLASHIKGCVAEDIKMGREDTVDDLVKTLQKLMR